MSRRPIAALLGLLLSLTLVACGDDTESPETSPTTEPSAATFPITLTTPAGEVTIESEPQAIVSLSPTTTETLFAIGAGDQVVAVDKNSNFPAEVPDGDLDSYEPNVEAIVAYEPDLVVLSNDNNDVVAQLQKLDIPVLIQEAPTSLERVFEEIEQLGRATGHVEAAEGLADSMAAELDDLFASTDADGLTYYYELDNTYYSQTSRTFLGIVLGELGLVNIADDADATDSDYPQLSAEHIIQSDPDLVLLADTKCCGQSAETLAARPGWDGLKAIANGGVVELDDDIASRWGPRLVDLVRQVAEAAEQVAAAA